MSQKIVKNLSILFLIGALIFSSALLYIAFHLSYKGAGLHNIIFRAKDNYSIDFKGIIHIGASKAEELKLYESLDVKDVLWIEADPDTYTKLQNEVSSSSINSKTENFAASDIDGEAEFYITNNKVSSSLMDLHLHKSVYPDVDLERKIKVQTRSLDSYFKESKSDLSKYNGIIIDVQGAELLVFKGATETLKSIDYIIAEVSPDEMYKGSVKIYELDAFLLEQGFVRLDTIMLSAICGDALYVKKDVISRKLDM